MQKIIIYKITEIYSLYSKLSDYYTMMMIPCLGTC